MAQSRNWIVRLTDIDQDSYEYGPYTARAAQAAMERIRRWIDRQTDRQGELFANCYPIHKWGPGDEAGEA